MGKKLFTKVFNWPVALSVVEWCCYICGVIVAGPLHAKLALLLAARVLP